MQALHNNDKTKWLTCRNEVRKMVFYQLVFGDESIFHISVKHNRHNVQISERFFKSEYTLEKMYDLFFFHDVFLKILSEEPLTGHFQWVPNASITRRQWRLTLVELHHIVVRDYVHENLPHSGSAEQPTTCHSCIDRQVTLV